MLINFTVGNFLSFRDKKTLSLEASSIKDAGSQIIEVGKLQLLPSAALYGANSSGKSNILGDRQFVIFKKLYRKTAGLALPS